MRNPLDPVVLGPVLVGDRAVVLRPGRPADAAQWRRIRLRDEALIAPYWVTDGRDWDSQHTEAVWLRRLVDDRDQTRAGTALHFVVDVDGQLAGQIDLTGIDPARHTAEFGIWLDSTLAGRRLGAVVGAMAVDHAFEDMGIRRITAPISTDNVPAQTAAGHVGMTHEATMTSYLDVGGVRRDHELWSILRDDHPTTALSRVLGDRGPTTGKQVATAYLRSDRVVPPTPGAALALLRHRLGRLRAQLTDRRGTTPDPATTGPVVLDAVNEQQRSATVRVRHGRTSPDLLSSATVSLVADALGHGGMCRVAATCDVGDEALARVFEAAGMSREGVLRDHVDADGRRGTHELWAATAVDRGRSTSGRMAPGGSDEARPSRASR